MTCISIREHQHIGEENCKSVSDYGIKFQKTEYEKPPVYLGIDPQSNKASYYIGACWLDEIRDLALVVRPKITNLDFIEMLNSALQFDLPSEYMSKFYNIEIDKKPIEVESNCHDFTLLQIVHYISIIRRITKKGLRNDYIIKEENLKSKVKGRIAISQNYRTNILKKRLDRIYCRFQEYSVDTLENRLLKKALRFSLKYLSSFHSDTVQNISSKLRTCLSYFHEVSDQLDVQQISLISQNSLYKDHYEAVNIANSILKRFNYSIVNASSQVNKIPPFWIDMSRLYEVYIYDLLYKKYRNDIYFQVKGHFQTAVDFVKKTESLIIDTKYKPHYMDSKRGLISDIRQISGYARDEKILSHLQNKELVPPCLIIYPECPDNNNPCRQLCSFEKDNLLDEATAVKGFKNFYILSVPLPVSL